MYHMIVLFITIHHNSSLFSLAILLSGDGSGGREREIVRLKDQMMARC